MIEEGDAQKVVDSTPQGGELNPAKAVEPAGLEVREGCAQAEGQAVGQAEGNAQKAVDSNLQFVLDENVPKEVDHAGPEGGVRCAQAEGEMNSDMNSDSGRGGDMTSDNGPGGEEVANANGE